MTGLRGALGQIVAGPAGEIAGAPAAELTVLSDSAEQIAAHPDAGPEQGDRAG